ncbi:ABC transporter ATP-binding protein [Petroclostridium sp. X23]|uniref:ABC transporter ATP-binding protein n=1 Tax=Petroclostridium sp. X23 TaxID=3045146 RepID=UPI0024AC8429|nr:ABC transporter ATP-binding protein [Petroclostridium sp. X23]WHH58759.1 ABC transporter ATP-binding protein [Petroclostridium sp. X23]
MSTEIINVSKKFGAFEALKSVSLSIRNGEFVAILGPSGCGKTTLLRSIAGFEALYSGEIKINGATVSGANFILPPEERNIGMVFQSFALWPHMNVRQHLQFPIRYHRFVSQDIKKNEQKRIEEILSVTGLSHLSGRMPNELSGGQKQRVALARAIAAKPALLLMDEPLSSLDAELRINMRREIQNIHRFTKTAIVYVTHDQAEALAMADRVVIMKDGKIEQIGTPEEIYCKPHTEFVARFVGKANLVKGKWEGDKFYPSGMNQDTYWVIDTVTENLRQKGICPVRPEQFSILEHGEGIPGTIKNAQYQGKEIHYNVQVMKETYEVHNDQFKRYSLGEQVLLQFVP